MNTSFVDNILHNDSIQVHGSLNAYCKNEGGSCDTSSSSDASLDDFKNRVKIWMRLDNELKELDAKMKLLDNERKQRKKYMLTLTPYILTYMNQNEIEELNSKDGRLQYKTSMRKVPLSQKLLKNELYNCFGDQKATLDKIFVEREKVERVILRRIM
jgi:hypothetical protein